MQSDNKNAVLPIFALLTSAVFWGAIWYPYRWLNEMGVSGVMSTFVTYGMALMVGLPFYYNHLKSISNAKWIWLAIVVSSGWTNTGYVLAVIHGEIMRVLLLFYLAPLWTVLFSRWILDEKLCRTGYLVIVLSLLGAMVMLWQAGGRLPLPANAAEWLGLSVGMSFAFTNVLIRKAVHVSIEAKSIGIWIGGTLAPLPLLLMQPSAFSALAGLALPIWGILFVIALAMIGITLCIQYGLMRVAANRAIVILLFELVVAAISAYLLAGESLSGREWLGAAMIMTASLFSAHLEQRHK
jgi:drug/metabolite transporter (DMT)-like permease